jgi:protein TonB
MNATNSSTAATADARRRPLPATGLPSSREDRRGWGVLSALLHVLVIALLITPMATHEGFVQEIAQGAGGAGPAGGGGGGKRGTGGVQEHVHYVQTAPAPAPTPTQPAVVPPPVVQPPKPEVIPPPPPVAKVAEPTPEKIEAKVEPAKIDATATTPGTGGGSGHDGSAGSGPGSGGGVGSGIGTGRGSGVGPGTGGGVQANYPPTAIEVFIPPLPVPDKVRGFHLVAEFDVDETGKVVDGGFKFTPTPDRGYNRRLDDVLKGTKFRPGTTPDGKPIRMKAQITYDF